MPLPQEFAGYLEEVLTRLPIVTAVLVVGVGAPVFEELLCRGLIAGDLLEDFSPVVAVGFSSLVFGFLHFNPWQGVPAFFTGLVLGLVYFRSKGLLYAIWGHGVYNLGILGLSRIDLGGSSYSQPTFQDLVFTVPGALLGLGIFLFGARRFLRVVHDPKEDLLLEGLEKNGL
jgi:membrane protease YdiL (CAAX protease family)